MVDVIPMQFAHMIQLLMQSDVTARLVISIQALIQMLSAQVKEHSFNYSSIECIHQLYIVYVVDVCQINNGGCGTNALCSRDSKTNIAKCTCKPAYVDTGSQSRVICTGITVKL